MTNWKLATLVMATLSYWLHLPQSLSHSRRQGTLPYRCVTQRSRQEMLRIYKNGCGRDCRHKVEDVGIIRMKNGIGSLSFRTFSWTEFSSGLWTGNRTSVLWRRLGWMFREGVILPVRVLHFAILQEPCDRLRCDSSVAGGVLKHQCIGISTIAMIL